MRLLENPVREYPWGSTTVLPRLLDRPADGSPQAELWIGAHPDSPSTVDEVVGAGAGDAADEVGGTLVDAIARDPAAALGPKVTSRFGDRLPFLLKVLAVEEPLSLQAHPSLEQARAGHAGEDGAGIPADSPDRTYGDDNHKPEMLWALTAFDALCGFRPLAATVELHRRLDVAALRPDVDELASGAADLGDLVARWLRLSSDEVPQVVAELRAAAQALVSPGEMFVAEAATICELAARHPADGGVLVASLLNRVHLEPGEALFSAAGVLHAYLHGTGVELMASSDNVLRGGLTSKKVDVDGLLDILDRSPGEPAILRAESTAAGGEVYRVPVPDFAMAVLRPGPGRTYDLPAGEPQLLLTVDGAARLTQAGAVVDLPRGRAVFVAASEPGVRVDGNGIVVRATTGDVHLHRAGHRP